MSTADNNFTPNRKQIEAMADLLTARVESRLWDGAPAQRDDLRLAVALLRGCLAMPGPHHLVGVRKTIRLNDDQVPPKILCSGTEDECLAHARAADPGATLVAADLPVAISESWTWWIVSTGGAEG